MITYIVLYTVLCESFTSTLALHDQRGWGHHLILAQVEEEGQGKMEEGWGYTEGGRGKRRRGKKRSRVHG